MAHDVASDLGLHCLPIVTLAQKANNSLYISMELLSFCAKVMQCPLSGSLGINGLNLNKTNLFYFHRHLGSQLAELEKLIDIMIQEEFHKHVSSELNRPVLDTVPLLDEVKTLM